MKALLLFCNFTFCWALVVTAQTFPTTADEPFWKESESGIPWSLSQEYTMIGDTTINNKNYEILFERELYNFNVYSDGVKGWIREDNNVIFFREDSVDHILYDFNVNIGDTIQWWGLDTNPSSPMYFIVSTVDSITIKNEPRKRIGFDLAPNDSLVIEIAYVIEGVGSDRGLLPHYGYFESGGGLDCYMEKDTFLFSRYTFSDCTTMSTKKIFTQKEINIAPNPSNYQIEISIEDYLTNGRIEVYDLNGKRVIQERFEGNRQVLNITELESGLYILLIKTENGIYRNKFIKL